MKLSQIITENDECDPNKLVDILYDEDFGEWIAEYGGDVIN